MPRVLLFGALWMAVIGAIGYALMRLPARPARTVDVRSAPAPAPAPPRAGQRFPGWTVTRAYSGHQMMVVEVEAERPATARQIATQIVEPLKDRYDEVLIYVRAPDAPADALPSRRIQWTKREGYVESIYDGKP